MPMTSSIERLPAQESSLCVGPLGGRVDSARKLLLIRAFVLAWTSYRLRLSESHVHPRPTVDGVSGHGAPFGYATDVPPSPAPKTPMAAFHTLPFLRCETNLPRLPGGDGRGCRYQLSAQGEDATSRDIPIGRDTCAGPLPDTSTLERGLAIGQDGKTITPGREAVRQKWAVDQSSRALVRGHYAKKIQFYPLAPEGQGPTDVLFPGDPPGLVHEAAIGPALGLQRTFYAGGLHRVTGTFDELAVSRMTAGICRTRHCADLSAVDILCGWATAFEGPGLAPVLTVPSVGGFFGARGGPCPYFRRRWCANGARARPWQDAR